MAKTAVIYMSGEKKIEQKLFCYMYASEKDYKVLYETDKLEEVYGCDIMLAANPSKISRNVVEFYGIVNDLKDNGIEVEFAIDKESAGRYIDMLTKLYLKGRV